MADEVRLIDLRHPFYNTDSADWQLWRDVYEGGSAFINKYLEMFSKREDLHEFDTRRKLTYNSNYAANAVDEVKNSIYNSMDSVSRRDGSPSYMDAIEGKKGGVDLNGSTMKYYIGKKALAELLTMKRVGIYTDMPQVSGETMMDVAKQNIRPYIYHYRTEEILNWAIDTSANQNEFVRLLLKEQYTQWHPTYKMPMGTATRYRYMWVEGGKCFCQFFDNEEKMIDMYGRPVGGPYELTIPKIPFVLAELPRSLMQDIARHQVALMNTESTDINYIHKANFPLYTEQLDDRADNMHRTRPAVDTDGSTIISAGRPNQTIAMGVGTGRGYGKNLNPPAFIHPSAEPLMASMEKQEQIKRDMRLLVHLAITNMSPTKQQSAESKGMDTKGLEAGLSFIGLELERVENRIAEYWALYENNKAATVKYPTSYSLRSDTDRQNETDHLRKILPSIPSVTLQKLIAVRIAHNTVGAMASRDEIDNIVAEIKKAKIVNSDPEIIIKMVEGGILDKSNAAESQLYPPDAVEKANKEHAERLATIQAAQGDPAARGNKDASGDPSAAKLERQSNRNGDLSSVAGDQTRGDGK